MVKRVSAAEAKAHLSELLAGVAHGGQQYVIERRGKPVAALVSVEDLDWLRQHRATSPRPRGALALVGAWGDVGDRELESLVATIYEHRQRDTGRMVELEE